MNEIDAEAERTWPQELQNALTQLEPQIAAYHVLRAQIDRAAVDDVMLRINRPENPNQDAWTELVELADSLVMGGHLLGFHATRLTDAEQADIRNKGLRVLSEQMLFERMAAVEAAGSVLTGQLKRLQARHQASDDNRKGMLWFSFTRAPLRDESSVERLFRSWGGEALYNSHEDDSVTGPVLAVIGQPCVIIAAVQCDGLETFTSIGERLVNIWCDARGIATGHRSGFEGYTRADIPAADIVDVVPLGDAKFETLTGHSGWRKPLT
jgi:hypothetical protein